MKSVKILAASLSLVALLAGCTKEHYTGGIDGSLPAVTDVTCTDAPYSGKSVTIQWNASNAVSAGATSFTLQLVASNLDTVEIQKPDNYNTALSKTVAVSEEIKDGIYTGTISGQTKGNVYYVKVRANYVKSAYSEWAWLTNAKTGERAKFKMGRGIITEGIEDPYLYKVTPTSTGIIIKWDAIDNAAGYVVEYKKSTESSWTSINISDPATVSCKIKDLPSQTEYNVRAKTLATDGEYSDYCEEQTVSTRQPGSYPAQMKTADELIAWLEGGVVEVEAGQTFSIENDINLDGQSFTAMEEPFMGIFDGKGFTISGIASTLFYKNEGTIKNLKTKGSITVAEGTVNFGAFATYNTGTIESCVSNVAVTYKAAADAEFYVGGFCSDNSGKITDCTNSGAVKVTTTTGKTPAALGGLCALSSGTLTKCINNGAVTYEASDCIQQIGVAGIAACIEGTATECDNYGDVTLAALYVDPTASSKFLPILEGRIYASATKPTPGVGGIAAFSYSSDVTVPYLVDCGNNGAVNFTISDISKTSTTVERVQVGGIVANPYGLVKGCTNNGKVNAQALTSSLAASSGTFLLCVGGIGGADWYPATQAATSYEGCVNNGDIDVKKYDKVGSSNATCGGICGWPGAEGSRTNYTKNCTNNGNITMSGTGKIRIGGIHGGSGAIDGCVNNGTVYFSSGDAASAMGGLAGFSSNGFTIANSESRGVVKSDVALTGGCAGGVGNLGNSANSGKFTDCVIATKVVNPEETNTVTGMIIGKYNGTSASVPVGASGAPKISGIVSFGGKATTLTASNFESYLVGTMNAAGTAHAVNAKFDSTPYVDPEGPGEEPEESKLSAPKNIVITVLYNSVTVTWDKVENAEWYVAEYLNKSLDGAEWTAGEKTEENSYIFNGLAHGTDYSFRVKAYATTSSSYSDVTSEKTLPEVILTKPVITSTDSDQKTVTLKWDAVTGATGYKTAYKLATAEEWSELPEVATCEATVSGLKPSTEYFVKVKALGEGGNEGEYCDSVSVTTKALEITYPYTISTGAAFTEWLPFASLCKETDEVILGADIDLAGQTITPAESFAGILNGAGKTIKNAKVVLFRTLSGTVKDLTLNSDIKAEYTADESTVGHPLAALALVSTGNVTNCANKGAVTMTSTSVLGSPVVAGLVAFQQGGTFKGNSNTGAISLTHAGTANVAIDGFNRKPFCVASGVVGVIVKATAEDCTNEGNVNVKANDATKVTARHYVGGIVGTPEDAVIKNCTNKGAVTADFDEKASALTANGKQVWTGGIAGARNGDIKDIDGATIDGCNNYGEITMIIDYGSSNNYIAGIAGQATIEAQGSVTTLFKIVNSNNYGKLVQKGVGKVRIGGISAGAATADNCTNSGEIVVENANEASVIGGIIGYPTQPYHPVTNCKNTGNISINCDALVSVGGLFGECGNTAQDYSGCSVNCTITAPAGADCGIIVGKANNKSGKAITFGTAEAPFKVKGSVKGTALTADNYQDYLGGVLNAGGTTDTSNVKFWAE